jgi:hypothetical protein
VACVQLRSIRRIFEEVAHELRRARQIVDRFEERYDVELAIEGQGPVGDVPAEKSRFLCEQENFENVADAVSHADHVSRDRASRKRSLCRAHDFEDIENAARVGAERRFTGEQRTRVRELSPQQGELLGFGHVRIPLAVLDQTRGLDQLIESQRVLVAVLAYVECRKVKPEGFGLRDELTERPFSD